MDLQENIVDINLLPSDHLFNQTERICLFGSSNAGKTHLAVNLIRRYSDKFYKIVLCGNRNDLLTAAETSNKTEMYIADSQGEEIYNPFKDLDSYDVKKFGPKQLLIVFDDIQEYAYKSEVLSQLFSKGRHYNISIFLILQTYFPRGSGNSLMPQIKNNTTVQIFFKCRSHSEIATIASRLEYGKRDRDFFVSLFKKLVLEKRFGYLAVFLDCSDSRLRYANNLIGEDNSPFLTVYKAR